MINGTYYKSVASYITHQCILGGVRLVNEVWEEYLKINRIKIKHMEW